MPADRVILVTGGGGFVGSRFAEIIFLTRFARVRVGVRSWAGAARAARFPVDIMLCDVLDRRQVAEAVKGVSVIVHCAVGDRRVIVDGTRNVLEAAACAGVSRFIHLSTAEVYGPYVSGRIDETWPCVSSGSAYADAKIEAEGLVWAHSSRGLPVTVFRPSIVYGPSSDQWTAALAQRLQSGCWGQYERYGDGTCNVVYVDDLVTAALSSIHTDRAVGQAFNVGGPDILTWNEYFERFNAALGRPPLVVRSAPRARLRSMVTGTVRAAAHVVLAHHGETLMRIYERGGLAAAGMKRVKAWLTTSPSSTELERLYRRKAIYDWSKAERMLRYRPAFDIDRGLRLSVDWLRDAGVCTEERIPAEASRAQRQAADA
jgi:nucleoside-diphosphate-sugar epimerase